MSAGVATLKLRTTYNLTIREAEVQDTYEVFTTDASDGPDVVLSASGLPALSSASPYDILSRVTAVRPMRQEDSTTHWLVEVSYARGTGDNEQDHQQPPTLRPVKRSASVKWTQRALMQDEDGDPIITTAKTPFDPPLEVALPHPVVRFTRWESSFSSSIIKAYVGKVNSSTFGAYGAGWVMCTNIEATEEWEQDANGNPTKFWMVTYEFEACYDEQDTFRPYKILNADVFFLDTADSNKRKLLYIDNAGTLGAEDDLANGAVPVPKAIPLTSTGAPIAAAGLPASAHYLEFNIYAEADFGALGLPVD
jgi:hypothetical protein